MFFYASRDRTSSSGRMTFQSPEGDSLFFYLACERRRWARGVSFQSPEGDSLFFYPMLASVRGLPLMGDVSVPRRGFVVFLLDDADWKNCNTSYVSVPRRGFVVFLRRAEIRCHQDLWVSVPRRGFVVFLLSFDELGVLQAEFSFSPPKGIRCFTTLTK